MEIKAQIAKILQFKQVNQVDTTRNIHLLRNITSYGDRGATIQL